MPHHYKNIDYIDALEPYKQFEDNLVFVFFDPWTLRHSKAEQIINAITTNGFKLIQSVYKNLQESDIEQIYRKNPPITLTTSWHIPKEIYTMGESLGLLFYRADSTESASGRLKGLKGSSQPLLTKPGQIRFDFRAPNKSLSLMHSSDDWYSMLNECSPFFTKSSMKRMFENIIGNKIENITLDFSSHSPYVSMERVSEQSATNLLLKLRIRILDQINTQNNSDSIQPYKTFLSEKNKVNYLQYTVREENQLYNAFIVEEKKYIKSFTSSIGFENYFLPRLYYNNINTARLLNGLRLLNEIENYSTIETSEITELPIFFDNWEKLLFKTTYFHYSD